MIRIRGRKNIVRDIRSHITRLVVIPIDLRWHTLNLRDRVSLGEDTAGVYIALHIVLGSLPGPVRAPFDAGADRAFVVSALGAACRGVLAP